MTDETPLDPERDLEITRIIPAPRSRVWEAWATPSKLEQWWLPAPAVCRVDALDLRPGGAFVTSMSTGGLDFEPHISGCFLHVEPGSRLVFTTALTAGWRPADGFMTASMTFTDADGGTRYHARVLHKDSADREMHRTAGFEDGWGTVLAQLATFLTPATV